MLSLGRKIKFGGSRIGVESFSRSSGSRELKEWFLASRDWQKVLLEWAVLSHILRERKKWDVTNKEVHINKQAAR